MKHKKSLTFSIFLLPLLLTSCGNPNSSTLSSPTSIQPGSTIDTTPTSKQTDTGVKATTSSTPDEPEDDPDIIKPEDSPWSEEVTKAMVKYLGGNILPYIDIGKDIDIKWNENDSKDNYRSSLVLTGEKFVEASLTDAENLYDGYSWSTMVYDTSFYAKSEKQHLQISVTSNKDLFELKAYYTEPFDPEAVTDWKDEEKTKLKDYFGKYYNIPFVYLGTTNYSVEFNDDTSKVMVVTGGTWNDQVDQVFEDAFAGTTWVVEVDTEDASKEIATYTDELSGTTVVATLAKGTGNKATMTVALNEKFSKENQTDWPSDVKTEISNICNGKTLSYVYLGAVHPTIDSNNTNSRKLTLSGGLWDNSIFDDAREPFVINGGWTEVKETETDKVEADQADDATDDDTDTPLGETKVEFSLGGEHDSYKATLTKEAAKTEGEYYPKLVVTKTENYDPSTITAWTQAIKDGFADKFTDGIDEILPFMYLGAATPYITKNEKVTDELYVQLAGSTWNSEVIDLAKEKLDADTTDGGWHTKIVKGTTQSIQAYKIYSDHSALRLELKKNSATINSVKTPIVLNIYYDKVDSTATVKTWNDLTDATATKDSNKLSTVMASVFDNKTIPEFLLLKDGLKLSNVSSTTTETSNKCVCFDLYNAEFAPSNLYRIADTLENAGYEIDLDAFGHGAYPSIVAHIKNTDGSHFYIHISTYSSSYPSATATNPTQPGYDVKIIYLPSYSKYSSITEWNDKTKGYMETKFGFVLPYFNIGVSKTGYVTLYSSPSATTATSDRIYFTGYNYDADEFSKITTVLDADGWSTSMSYEAPSSKSYALTKVITATKTIGDDAFLFTAKPNLYCKYSSSAIYSVTYSIQRFDSKFII